MNKIKTKEELRAVRKQMFEEMEEKLRADKSPGSEKFKPLIEKYSMLQNLREELLVDKCSTTLNYSESAYNHYGK